MIIGLVTWIFTIKIAAIKSLILEVVEIGRDGMHTKIDLIEQDIKILLKFAMVRLKIRSFKTIVIYLVYYLKTPVFGI